MGCRQEDDMGELNFNSYDAALLEGGDEEEATTMLDTPQQEQEDQEVLQCWRASWAVVRKSTSEIYWNRETAMSVTSPKSTAPSCIVGGLLDLGRTSLGAEYKTDYFRLSLLRCAGLLLQHAVSSHVMPNKHSSFGPFADGVS